MDPAIERQLCEQLDQLTPDQQRQVLNFARSLAATRASGVSGQVLARFGGAIAKDDFAIMSQAIEEGCEQVPAG